MMVKKRWRYKAILIRKLVLWGHKSKQKNGGILGNRSNKKENSCTSMSRIWPVFIKSLSVRPSCGFFTR